MIHVFNGILTLLTVERHFNQCCLLSKFSLDACRNKMLTISEKFLFRNYYIIIKGKIALNVHKRYCVILSVTFWRWLFHCLCEIRVVVCWTITLFKLLSSRIYFVAVKNLALSFSCAAHESGVPEENKQFV